MEPISILVTAALLALAAGLAMWVRARDEPKTPFDMAHWKAHAEVFVASLVAGGLAAWFFNYDVLTADGFVAVLGIAGTGFAFIAGLVPKNAAE
jgi:hypothetical protein